MSVPVVSTTPAGLEPATPKTAQAPLIARLRHRCSHACVAADRAPAALRRAVVSKLLFNLIIMGLVLKMDKFSKDQQVGTYCIACAILTLPDVGPADQPGADAIALVTQPIAIIWIIVLTLATVACCVGMVALARRKEPPPMLVALAVYVLAQVWRV